MIELKQISKVFHVKKQTITALEEVDLSIKRGEIFGIIGHSGAGKSTLIRTINLLERPSSGQVLIDGVDLMTLSTRRLQEERRTMGMIFQHFNLLSSATVVDNIAFPLRLAKMPAPKVKERVQELLGLVGLTDQANQYPAQLSGGQKQRVGIARALATNPKVLLCDEATSALDPQTTNSILTLLMDINRKLNITIVLITHEMHVIRSICDRVAVLDSGSIVELGQVAEVFLKPQHPTTKEFIAQVADMNVADMPKPNADTSGSKHLVARITFLGEQTYDTVLYDVMKKTDVPFAILQGTISKLKDIPYGQLTVELRGSRENAEQAIGALRGRGLDVEVISNG